MSLTLLFYSSRETHDSADQHAIFLDFNDKKVAALNVKNGLSLVIKFLFNTLSEVLKQSVGTALTKSSARMRSLFFFWRNQSGAS